jgi:mannosyltransferase
MNQADFSSKESIVIIPNLGRRFSGVTSTMLQTLSQQIRLIDLAVWGGVHVDSNKYPVIGFWRLLRITKAPLSDDRHRVFHARRNVEMLSGIILKYVFGRRLKLLFTSTAQRNHSKYTRTLIRYMDAVITTSNRAGRYLEKPADFVIPHGIRIDRYPCENNKQVAWSRLGLVGEKGIGIFGRIRPQKGVDLFVDAMIESLPRFPEYTAVIVGKVTPKFEGFVRDQKAKIKAGGLEKRFLWLGEVDFEKLPALYGAMSIVASVSRVEGFGLTCLEAMSSGTPAIASRTGGFELVVRDGIDGVIVDCSNSSQIASAFSRMAGDPLLLQSMSLSSRKRIEESFTIEREALELVRVYNSYSNIKFKY